MKEINIKTKAKVNLCIDVLRRREDNYHDMKMIMQDVDLCDDITLEINDTNQICIITNMSFLPTDERNLANKAVRLFYEFTGLEFTGLDIKIDKKIPVSAGLAGGSTNAAGVLKGLNILHDTKIPIKELCRLGKQIGADVPYCILGGTALAEGIGDILTPLESLPDCYFVIAKPNVSVSTKHVFTSLDTKNIKLRPDVDGMIEALGKGDLGAIARRMYNVLEIVTATEHKIVDIIKNVMIDNGALGALMSGSGPSVFGIYDKYDLAIKSRDALKHLVKDVFVCQHKKNI